MLLPRPVPLIGDPTSAGARAADPQAWAFSSAEQDALRRITLARRDIRRFRPDPIPVQLLQQLFDAAHAAPSVGHSQPWRFIVVQDGRTRDQAALLADRERLVQAAKLKPDARRRMLDLQLEGIREAPVGIVVCCDSRVAAEGVLGRATFTDADLWSCACAIENLWLSARSLGLGVGWVTLFEPRELGALLAIPDGVQTLGWLCVGWPDERPPGPGLERAGWSERLPVGSVVMSERWADAAVAPPASQLLAPGQAAVVRARDRADELLTPPGSLGTLDQVLNRVTALGIGDISDGTLVVAGADHPVVKHSVSAYSAAVTASVMAAMVAGTAAGAVAAVGAGLQLRVVDAGVAGPGVSGALTARPLGVRGDLVGDDALTASDTAWLVNLGRELGADGALGSVVAVGEVGMGNTTVAAILAGSLLGLGADEVTGFGAGADTAMFARKRDVIERASRRAAARYAKAITEPAVALQAVGGPEFAVLTGAILGVAGRGGLVVLDGLATSVCALLAVRLEPAVAAHLVAGQRSREPAHEAVLAELGLQPLLDLRLRAGEGVGACLAVSLVRAGLRLRRDTARTAPVR